MKLFSILAIAVGRASGWPRVRHRVDVPQNLMNVVNVVRQH